MSGGEGPAKPEDELGVASWTARHRGDHGRVNGKLQGASQRHSSVILCRCHLISTQATCSILKRTGYDGQTESMRGDVAAPEGTR
jgi:hypothetical protein